MLTHREALQRSDICEIRAQWPSFQWDRRLWFPSLHVFSVSEGNPDDFRQVFKFEETYHGPQHNECQKVADPPEHIRGE
jgi:hypothetical protein